MNKDQLRDLIERVLKEANLYSESAVELLMLTCAQESRLGKYIRQLGGGPALGIFQMEPFTHDDLWRTHGHILKDLLGEPDSKKLEYDLRYATIMSRIHYFRIPKPLPEAGDIEALAAYWKKYYNTYLGAGKIEEAVEAYNTYCV